MATKKTQAAAKKKVARKKRNLHTTGFIFWICLILIIAPLAILGWILMSSYMDSGTPVLGNRYEGDLDPAITKDQMAEVENAIGALSDIEDYSVQMVTATMRVYVDIPDSWNVDQAKEKSKEVYKTVQAILDTDVYFTQHDGKKMYDLEVHVYNLTEDRDSDEFVYVIRNKTSSMPKSRVAVVSEPRDAALAEQLRKDVEERKKAEEEARLAEEAAEAEAAAKAEEGGETEETTEETSEENSEG